MVKPEHVEITYALEAAPSELTLRWLLVERGFYPIPRDISYVHPHPVFNRLFFFLRGGAEVRYHHHRQQLMARNVYLLPVNRSFEITYQAGSELIFFHANLLDPTGMDVFDSTPLPLTLAADQGLFEDLISIREPGVEAVRWQNAVFRAMCLLAAPQFGSVRQRLSRNDRYGELMAYIEKNCRADLTVSDLATHMHLSRAALSKGFQRATGIALKDHLTRMLLQRARRLLAHTDDSVKEIADHLGYEEPSYFRRVFRRETGYTPLQYRSHSNLLNPQPSVAEVSASPPAICSQKPEGATASAAGSPPTLPPTVSSPNHRKRLFQPFALPSGRFSGDTFPVFREGVCHLFHMMPPVIAHHVSRDLIHWEPCPIVVAPGQEGEPDSLNNATGCVIEHEGRFFLFYTGNQNVCLATSDDLNHWVKHPGNPVVQGDNRRYKTVNFRDPFVFFHKPERCWWMLFGTQTMDQPSQRAGCVGLAKSKDLFQWEFCPPLWEPGIGPHADCPQLIRHAKRWILFYLQRNTRYRVADSAAGPFRRPPNRNLTTPLANAGSRPVFDGKRWISFPFVARLKDDSDWGDWEYGGPLAIPRQLDIGKNGVITERPLPEMITAIRSLAETMDPFRTANSVRGRWLFQANRSAVCKSPSGGTLLLPALPPDFYLEFEVILPDRDSDFHLLLRTTPDLLHGYQLSLHPRTAQVSLRPITIWDVDRVLVSRSLDIPVGKPLKAQVFLSGSILEVFFGDRASLTSRLYNRYDGHVGFEFRDGGGTIRNLVWRPLAGVQGVPS